MDINNNDRDEVNNLLEPIAKVLQGKKDVLKAGEEKSLLFPDLDPMGRAYVRSTLERMLGDIDLNTSRDADGLDQTHVQDHCRKLGTLAVNMGMVETTDGINMTEWAFGKATVDEKEGLQQTVAEIAYAIKEDLKRIKKINGLKACADIQDGGSGYIS